MLSAYDETGALICLVDSPTVRGKSFSCPACQGQVILKRGTRYRPHFAHKRLKDCTWYQENESAEHLNLKASLYQSLSLTEDVHIEYLFADIKQIADLLVNQQLILEVQCSPLSHDRLRERTQSYLKVGFQVRWLLGEKLWLGKKLTQLHRDCLYFSKNMGFHLWELDDKKGLLRLKYLIHEDLEGQVHHLTRIVPFDELTLSDFRLPFLKQKCHRLKVYQNQAIHTYIQKQLYYKSAFWLKEQAMAYEKGDNLLTRPLAAFYPQVRLPRLVASDFPQITEDLTTYYQHFDRFYQAQGDKTYQILYSPAYILRK